MTNSASVLCSNLPSDRDLIRALGDFVLPVTLVAGDVWFSGAGEAQRSLSVCVERKRLGDLARCLNDGRYQHQLQTAREQGADVFVLIAEGVARAGSDGLLERPSWGVNPRTGHRCQLWVPVYPPVTYSRFDQYLTELDYLVGVMVKRSRDVHETAAIIRALWDNFQSTPSQHDALHKMWSAPVDSTLLVKPSLVRRVAAELPGIGWVWSGVAAVEFRTVEQLVHADLTRWEGLELVSGGRKRRLGRKAAMAIVNAIREDERCQPG